MNLLEEKLGLRVLVVEDEALIALMLEDMLKELGCTLVAQAGSLNEAVGAAESVAADVAVLDVNVGGREIFPVAEILAARGVPIAFSTGYTPTGLPGKWRARPVISKPFELGALRAALIAATSPR